MSKETRLKNAEEQSAEFMRGLAVMFVKLSHYGIEDIERERKKPLALSLIDRINSHQKDMWTYYTQALLQKDTQLPESQLKLFGGFIQTYKSIREDFKKSIDKKNNTLENLFPERQTAFTTIDEFFLVINNIMDQENQMRSYLLRYI